MSLTQRLRGFSNKAKYAIIVPLAVAAMACSEGYKDMVGQKNTQLYLNKDGSSLKLIVDKSKHREKSVFNIDPPITELKELDPDNCTIGEYVNDPKGILKTFKTKKYDDPEHPFDKEVLKEKQKEGRNHIYSLFPAIKKYIKRL